MTIEKKTLFNAIFYWLKTGCQWRMLPCCFPKLELGYYHFTKWKNTRIIEQKHELLCDKIREKAERDVSLSYNITDKQNIITTRLGDESRRTLNI